MATNDTSDSLSAREQLLALAKSMAQIGRLLDDFVNSPAVNVFDPDFKPAWAQALEDKVDHFAKMAEANASAIHKIQVAMAYNDACMPKRAFNGRAMDGGHPLAPLPTPPHVQPHDTMTDAPIAPPGSPPTMFPATLGSAHKLSAADVDALLAAYHIGADPTANLVAKRIRLCEFIGCAAPAPYPY